MIEVNTIPIDDVSTCNVHGCRSSAVIQIEIGKIHTNIVRLCAKHRLELIKKI
jgi:hypothetical protein